METFSIIHLLQNHIVGVVDGLSTCSALAIPPNPPASTSTLTGEPIFVQSYINAYNTAFNQETSNFSQNYQVALYKYAPFTPGDVNNNFVNGTFGYDEQYNNLQSGTYFTINSLQDDANYYDGNPYLFVHFSRLRRRIWLYVFGLDYSNLWSSLCCKCIIKIVKKLAGGIICMLGIDKV